MEATILENRRGRKIFNLLVSIAFTAVGILMIRDGAVVRGTFVTVVSGLLTVLSIRSAFSSRRRLLIDDRGIHDPSLGVGTIPWRTLKSVSLGSLYGNPIINLHLHDEAAWIARLSLWRRLLISLNKALGYAAFFVNLAGHKDQADHIYRNIQRRVRESYWLDVRDKPGLLRVVMRALAGEAHISFEGDLSRCRGLFEFAGASADETAALKRNTTYPIQDFVVLPLEEETVASILQEVGSGGRLVRDVVHIQIEKNGTFQFGSYDNFHPDGCVVWWGVAEASLNELQTKGVLRSYERAPNGGV